MIEVTVDDIEQTLDTLEGIAAHSGIWLDQNAITTARVRTNILRAVTVASNGVRRGRAMLNDGEPLIEIVEEVQGYANDASEILSGGPQFVSELYRGVAYLCHVMWRRCREHGCEQ